MISRRDFLRYAGIGSAGLIAGLPLANRAAAQGAFHPDLALELEARPERVALLPGAPIRVWKYHATVVHGDPASVEPLAGSWLGPTLHLRRGQRVQIDFINRLDQPGIVHWHGLHVPSDMDGHPRFAVGPGGRYRYRFTVLDRAGTYWYHPHPHHLTAEQVYRGLAGLLIVHDEEDDGAALPRGEYDVPIVIQDRDFDADNQLVYLRTAHGASAGESRQQTLMRRLMGFFGDEIVVNGRPRTALEVATHAYRLRVLNGSNARIYKLGFSDGRPMTVIGTDGGLLEAPLHRDYVMLSPAERVDLWVDFSADAVNTRVTLRSLAFQGSMGDTVRTGGLARAMDWGKLPDGAPFDVVDFRVTRKVQEPMPLPLRLSTVERLDPARAINADSPRSFLIDLDIVHGLQWNLNGRSFEMTAVAPDEIVRLDTTEVWEFINSAWMAHAMHVHDLQFQVVERSRGPGSDASRGGDVSAGYVDEGWKDTVLVMPGERIKLVMRFRNFPGLFMYHCHMLEHADAGLMRNFLVRA